MKRIGGNEEAFRKLETLLDAAEASAFKIWELEPVLKVARWIILTMALAGILLICYQWRDTAVMTYGWVGVAILSILAGIGLAKVFGARIANRISSLGTPNRIQTEIWRIAAFAIVAVIGFVAAWIHIGVFDRWYKSRGRLQRITGVPATPENKPLLKV